MEATQRFWETIIEPVLAILHPKAIVEIGSDTGGNTLNLLEFCRRSNAKLYVIDPVPKYDVSAWQERHGEHLVFYQDLSLNALQLIDVFDVVLIDGDHNWYTVLNELKLIEDRCEELSLPFPLVMLHDVDWPYGRRDLYYSPETIPEAYRQPHEKKGMHPESTGLLERGGLNPNLYNALRENEPRSGVLTAVEDFVRETEQRLHFLKIPGLHGLGILVPTKLKEQNKSLARFLDALELSEIAIRLIEQVELERLSTLAKLAEANGRVRELQHLRRRLKEMQNSRGWRIARTIDLATRRVRGIIRRG